MSLLPQELETIIYKYQHQLNMKDVIEEMKQVFRLCQCCDENKYMDICSQPYCCECQHFICYDCNCIQMNICRDCEELDEIFDAYHDEFVEYEFVEYDTELDIDGELFDELITNYNEY